jgi:hypothetical protein
MRGVADESWMGEERGGGGLFVKFGLHPKKNDARSLEAGRPIFDDVEYVEIRVPGDKHNVIHRPVGDSDRRQFARAYQAWKSGAGEQLTGTPLAEWPAVSRSQVEELAYFGVRTVEQLANLSDGNAQQVGPIQALKAKALDYVAKAKGNAPLEQMRAELATRDNELETLRRQVTEQAEFIAELKKNNELKKGK